MKKGSAPSVAFILVSGLADKLYLAKAWTVPQTSPVSPTQLIVTFILNVSFWSTSTPSVGADILT